MTVILMTQDIGSSGTEVATGIAAELGLELIHQEQLEQYVAERMQIGKSTVHRLLAGNASLLERWRIDRRRLAHCMTEGIVRLAVRGNVLVQGPGATALLRQIRHVICVHISAPLRSRARAMRGRPAVVGEACDDVGWNNARVRRQLFAGASERPEDYDLVLNTERIPIAACVEQIRRLAQSSQFQPSAASRAMLANLAQEASRDLLLPDAAGAGFASVVEVEVGSHRMRLAGSLSSEQAIARVEEHLRGAKAHAAATVCRSCPPAPPGIV